MVLTNRVILTGRVARTPLRHVRPDGSLAIRFSLEVNPEGRDLPGQSAKASKKSRFEIVGLGPVAEAGLALLQCGQSLRVEGHLRQRRWKTPQGGERSCVEIVATELQKAVEIP